MKFGVRLSLIAFAALPFMSAAGAQTDCGARVMKEKLISLSSSRGGMPIDCGGTGMDRLNRKVSACASSVFKDHKPFEVLYSRQWGRFHLYYGLVGDAAGNTYEIEYDPRALLHLGLRKNSRVSDGNRLRVTTCLRPILLAKTQEGLLACVIPTNERESRLAAQQTPVETTICAILDHPSAFNNRLARIHGYASGNFEYSELQGDGCPGSLWFAYANGDGPPNLAITVNGGALPGEQDKDGRLILPVPLKLLQDSKFQRFQDLMKARAEANDRAFKENATPLAFYRVGATFLGRIDAVPDDVHAFHLKHGETGEANFLGFGQMGLFDAQFVLQSVEDDAALEESPATKNIEPPNI